MHTLCCRASPRSNLHFNRVATQPSQQYNSLMLPEIFTVVAGMRHRRTTPRHLLFPRNSLQAARGPSYRSLCGLVVDGTWECPLSHSMTPDQPCLIAKTQKAACTSLQLQGGLEGHYFVFPCLAFLPL